MEFDDVAVNAASMHLEHDEVWVMERDTFHINPVFTPSDVTISDLYWAVDNEDVAMVVDNDVIALNRGDANLTGISVSKRLTSGCIIHVLPFWSQPSDADYPYETVVYADATVNGEPLDTTRYVLGAFCDDICRGVAQLHDVRGKRYVSIRIGSNSPMNESGDLEFIVFRCYDREELRMYYCGACVFADGETHGTLSELMKMEFSK